MSMSHRSKGSALGEIYKRVSVREINVASNSPSSRDIKELEQAEREETCEWAFPVEALEMGNSQINKLLETREIYPILEPFPRIQKTRA